MSDNTGGLSGIAGFALGRMSAENDRVLMDAVRSFQNRGQAEETISIKEYNDLLEDNARLRRNLAVSREDYRKLDAAYDSLYEWAKCASAIMKRDCLIQD